MLEQLYSVSMYGKTPQKLAKNIREVLKEANTGPQSVKALPKTKKNLGSNKPPQHPKCSKYSAKYAALIIIC